MSVTNNRNISTKRTRLNPEARRTQLLISAKTLILDQGLNAFTMETLAIAAGVSNPLIYKYFATRLELLQAILLREHTIFSTELKQKLTTVTDARAIIKIFVVVNFDQHSEGNIISLLRHQPDIAATLIDIDQKELRHTGNFLVSILRKRFGFTKKQAELAANMSSGASIAAADYCRKSKGDKKALIEFALNFIWAGIEASG